MEEELLKLKIEKPLGYGKNKKKYILHKDGSSMIALTKINKASHNQLSFLAVWPCQLLGELGKRGVRGMGA